MPSSVTGEPWPPGTVRVELWDGISCARHLLSTPSPLPAHPPPFSSLLPGGSCLAFPFQFWALTLSFSWKIWHMEDDAPRPKGSISFASMAYGLENTGAELLDSLEEGRTPSSDLRPAEERDNWSKSSQEPFSGWRSLQPAMRVRHFCGEHTQLFRWICIGLLCTAFAAFLLVACLLDFQRALALFVLTCVVLAFLAHSLLKRLRGPKLLRCVRPLGHSCLNLWFKRGLALATFLGLVLWLVLDTSRRPEQLVSFAGTCVCISILFACSKHRHAVSWRVVSWGLGLQFVLGLLVIRTEPGFIAFQWLGDQIQSPLWNLPALDFCGLLSGGGSGQQCLSLGGWWCGGLPRQPQEVIRSPGSAPSRERKQQGQVRVLPIIVFFSCVMSVLYYVGLMQWVILKIAWLMQVTMGTTATETLSVAGNIFVSQVGPVAFPGKAGLWFAGALIQSRAPSPRVIKGGCPTNACLGVHFAWVMPGRMVSLLQIDAASLIAASVMAAPCALALSKLVYPEVEESKFRSAEGVRLSCGDAQNLLEATSSGAAVSVRIIANIAANLIAFLAVLAFINAALSWLGAMVDVQGLSFQLICSYALRPLAFLMGVAWEDCPVVAELLGIKLFLNEFVAYQELSQYKQRRLAGVEEWIGAKKQWISVRAEVLTTYALCGFANFSSIGIMLGGLTSMAPQRRSDFSQIVLRALCTGACVSLVNACVAGILYVPGGTQVNCTMLLNTTLSASSFEVYRCCREGFQSTGPEFSPQALDNCCRLYNHTICA
ncbi:sodium/nucleoside cotransporter 1 [Pteropus vampyrus]|uniref:Sodium/nucleoside cotransporter 1 n=1 Tax=Pteropus vampyrus TaxID=132908 RepID=A0A6P6BNZ9_PTEVA|nr:sodium/nucleoside cotransporter 1 [Pteropus vampyrus]